LPAYFDRAGVTNTGAEILPTNFGGRGNIGTGDLLEYGRSLRGNRVGSDRSASHAAIVARALAIPADRSCRAVTNELR